MSNSNIQLPQKPNADFKVSEVFKIKSDLIVKGYKEKTEWVPEVDNNYVFDQETTLSILAGFQHNRRVMVQGFHGTGKSTHIEQVAARLNWPCVRINLDSHISRIDLLGKDVIKLKDGKQITEFQEGLLPWSIQNPVALVFDEYDAGRPDVMFVIQRILEVEGKLTLLDQNKVINPHPSFRLFATTNTIGLGDVTGLYHGTQQINQGQLDRWHILSSLNYLSPTQELNVVSSRLKKLKSQKNKTLIKDMIQLANLTRAGFINGDISTIMSPRTVISWAENFTIFKDISASFKLSFFNKCDDTEKPIIAEYYQRCFGEDIQEKRPD
jgi:cobaltochelatase CobS